MDISSIQFVCFVFCGWLLCMIWPQPVLRTLIFTGMNLAFLFSYTNSVFSLVPLFLFLLTGFFCVRILARNASRSLLVLFIVALVAVFVYLKHYSICKCMQSLPFDYVTVGLSFILFRLLQIMYDVYVREIAQPISALDYFNFTCSFLTFVSGPIQRFQAYQEQKQSFLVFSPTRTDGLGAASRLLTGYIKILFLSGIFLAWQKNSAVYLLNWNNGIVSATLPAAAYWIICYACSAASYLLFLYMNFSGYMDLVIGAGLLFGWKLPENFRHPFAAENFLDFWSRWHITLSNWFKWYLYNPLLKALVTRRPSHTMLPYWGTASLFVAFFVMGIWHGTTSAFVFYGLFLGLGASVNRLYQIYLPKIIGKERTKILTALPFYRHMARGMALSYFSLALTCFWLDETSFYELLRRIPFWCELASWVILGFVIALLSALYENVAKRLPNWLQEDAIRLPNGWVASLWFLARAALLAWIILQNRTDIPDFVYKAF